MNSNCSACWHIFHDALASWNMPAEQLLFITPCSLNIVVKTFIESSENPTTNLRSKSTISFKWKKYVTISYIANAAS